MRFWKGGAWRIVVVDDWFPVRADGSLLFAQLPPQRCEFWPLIVEKAYAKLVCFSPLIFFLSFLL